MRNMASPISATIDESRCWTTERVMGSIVAGMETLRKDYRYWNRAKSLSRQYLFASDLLVIAGLDAPAWRRPE